MGTLHQGRASAAPEVCATPSTVLPRPQSGTSFSVPFLKTTISVPLFSCQIEDLGPSTIPALACWSSASLVFQGLCFSPFVVEHGYRTCSAPVVEHGYRTSAA